MPLPDVAYVPGVCNINRTEIAYRRKVGYLGLVVFIVLFGILLILGAPIWTRLLLVVPGVFAASGFLQAQNKFCVAYGAAGKQNADGDGMVALDVLDRSAIGKDKVRARVINIQSFCYGMAAVLLSLLM